MVNGKEQVLIKILRENCISWIQLAHISVVNANGTTEREPGTVHATDHAIPIMEKY